MTVPFRRAVQAELVRPEHDCSPGPAGPLARPRRSIPSIAGLLAFEATARHRSFSGAARDLNLSQGAVSKRVRQLEEVVGVALFARDRQRVSLTRAGTAYLEEIRWVLAGLEAATEQLTREEHSVSGIAVTAPPDFARYWLVPRLRAFQARHPEIVVNLAAHGAAGEEADVSIHLELCHGPGAAGVLLEERLIPMASPALLSRLAPTEPADLLCAPRLQRADRPDLWARWFEAAGATGTAPPSGPSYDSSDLLVAAAIEGHGFALLSEALLAPELAAERLEVAFPIPIASGLGFQVDLSRRRSSSLGAQLFRLWLLKESGARHDCTNMKGALAAARRSPSRPAAGLADNIRHRETQR